MGFKKTRQETMEVNGLSERVINYCWTRVDGSEFITIRSVGKIIRVKILMETSLKKFFAKRKNIVSVYITQTWGF